MLTEMFNWLDRDISAFPPVFSARVPVNDSNESILSDMSPSFFMILAVYSASEVENIFSKIFSGGAIVTLACGYSDAMCFFACSSIAVMDLVS